MIAWCPSGKKSFIGHLKGIYLLRKCSYLQKPFALSLTCEVYSREKKQCMCTNVVALTHTHMPSHTLVCQPRGGVHTLQAISAGYESGPLDSESGPVGTESGPVGTQSWDSSGRRRGHLNFLSWVKPKCNRLTRIMGFPGALTLFGPYSSVKVRILSLFLRFPGTLALLGHIQL